MDPVSIVLKADLDFLRDLVRRESGIVVDADKDYLLETRLAPVCRGAGIEGIGELVRRLRETPYHPLRDMVTEALTTNETSFFRDVHPFETLARHILPELVQRLRPNRRIGIWCAASSCGQEPYSLAMILRTRFPEVIDWTLDFVASDLSRQMIERCRRGVYSQLEVNRGLPVEYLARWFKQSGREWTLAPEIREMIHFRVMNLTASWREMPRCDLVLVRNVLIYFDQETRLRIFRGIEKLLQPGGYLLLGSTECLPEEVQGLERQQHGTTVYYRRI